MILVWRLLFVPHDSSNQNRSEFTIAHIVSMLLMLLLVVQRIQQRTKYVNQRTLPNPFYNPTSRNGWTMSSKRTKLQDSSSTAAYGE